MAFEQISKDCPWSRCNVTGIFYSSTKASIIFTKCFKFLASDVAICSSLYPKIIGAFDLLAAKEAGAGLPIDSLEFIDPILKEQNGEIKRNFHIAGVRHYIGYNGDNCEKALHLEEEID